MKAVIKTGGKQYYVSENDVIYTEKLNGSVGDEIIFDEVLAIDSKIGNPLVKGAKVTGKIEKHGKNKKIRIFTYKNKNRSNRRTMGHRQPYTKVTITKIEG